MRTGQILTFGETIRQLRTDRRMTVRELAERAGVSAPFIVDLEHDRRTTSRIIEFAAALSVDVRVLEDADARVTPQMRAWLNRQPVLIKALRKLMESGTTPEAIARKAARLALR